MSISELGAPPPPGFYYFYQFELPSVTSLWEWPPRVLLLTTFQKHQPTIGSFHPTVLTAVLSILFATVISLQAYFQLFSHIFIEGDHQRHSFELGNERPIQITGVVISTLHTNES